MDRDLQSLRREVARAPGEPDARLALGLALSRGGAATRIEALEALYLARALGAEAGPVRAALRALGAPPSPWTHRAGDESGRRLAPIRGPRRGEVAVARRISTPHEGVLDEDGTYLVGRGGSLARFRRFALSPLKERPVGGAPRFEVLPVAAPGRVLATTQYRHAELWSLEPDRPPAPVLAVGTRGSVALAVRPDGVAVFACARPEAGVRVHVVSPELSVARTIDLATPHDLAYRSGLALCEDRFVVWGHASQGLAACGDLEGRTRFTAPASHPQQFAFAAPDRLVSLSIARDASGWLARVTGFDAEGRVVWEHIAPGMNPGIAIGPDGSVYAALTPHLVRLDPAGRIAWSHAFRRVDRSLVVDAEGVVYARAERGPEPRHVRLIAVAPDGGTVFEAHENVTPVAIDVRGRLLGTRDPGAEVGELVAVE